MCLLSSTLTLFLRERDWAATVKSLTALSCDYSVQKEMVYLSEFFSKL